MTVKSSGTQVAVITTEHTLYTETTDNSILVLEVDTSAMVAGDMLQLRVKGRVLTAGADVQGQLITASGKQVSPLIVSVPYPSPFNAIFTLKQTAGTGRSFPWSVIAL